MTESSLLRLRKKKPNTIWSEFSPSAVLEVCADGNTLFVVSICLAFPPRVNYPASSYSAESISTFIFHFVFQLIVGRQVSISPVDGDWDAGDLDGASRFINT